MVECEQRGVVIWKKVRVETGEELARVLNKITFREISSETG